MKLNILIAFMLLLGGSDCSVAGQVIPVYRNAQPNVVLVGSQNDPDFKPTETRMLSKGTWRVQAIRVVGVNENRLTWTSWPSISADWGTRECNGGNRKGWTTVFYASAVGMEVIGDKWSRQFPSKVCATPEFALRAAENQIPHTFNLASNSAVTFFLGAFYDKRNAIPLGGGVILSLQKLRSRQEQRQNR